MYVHVYVHKYTEEGWKKTQLNDNSYYFWGERGMDWGGLQVEV